jgi:tetratricopeptide (TPR) repeat protein
MPRTHSLIRIEPLMPNTHCYFHDHGALLDRLATGLKRRAQEVVFLIGSPLSASRLPGSPGVPGVNGVIELIRAEFAADPGQLEKLNEVLDRAGLNRYQEAFLFLQGRRGQQTANEIIRNAVLNARTAPKSGSSDHGNLDDACRAMEFDTHGWALAPGIGALGRLIVDYPDRFGRSVLTTNFDPLLEIAIRHAGGVYFRTTLHADGNLSQTEGTGCHVIHLHGYWYGSDTLHTPQQLSQPRPRLRASLSSLLRNKLVIACGYGGWDDAFTEALMEVVRDDTAYPEIIWTFYENQPVLLDTLSERLSPGIDRGRITLYSGIDCNLFFPGLYDVWSRLDPCLKGSAPARSNPVHVTDALANELIAKPAATTILEGDDEDRPPLIDICVGRDNELGMLRESEAKTIFITGFGGQGKSTLAAKYYSEAQSTPSRFSLLVWRDCKEESERFETQLTSVIEKLSGGKISGKDLAQQSLEAIIDLLLTYIQNIDMLFVFDNADHYVDIDTRQMVGSADRFVTKLLGSSARTQVIFTCRPSIEYAGPSALSIHLEGIDLEAAQGLFAARRANSTLPRVEAAHTLTKGHAFWLDLLALQVAQGRDLDAILSEIRTGGGPLPATTLNSIWATLQDREQAVLRVMAETVKPESEATIADYLASSLTFNKVAKALRSLRSRNLVVIKPRLRGTDLLELHPLVRNFIRQSFPKPDRAPYIARILTVYKTVMGKFTTRLNQRPPLSVLQYWTQNAELDIAVGNFSDAFATLHQVVHAFLAGAYPRELARVSRLLFASVDWVAEHSAIPEFELVFQSHIRILSHLGETKEVDVLLDEYERTVPNRDARYIRYCELRCYSLWFRSAIAEAAKWGRIGQLLIESSDIDSAGSGSMKHALALAERDAGRPESALPIFLEGRALAQVVDPEELDERRRADHYGNIGRCLHFMGQIEAALVCYQKSALLLERGPEKENVMHRAYCRTWIGELLAGRDELKAAHTFLQSAVRLWQQVAPLKTLEVSGLMKDIEIRAGRQLRLSDGDAEKICMDWILGR